MTSNTSPRLPSDAEENTGFGIQDYRPLNVKDALAYLDQVQAKFSHQPNIYNDFLQVMKEFKSQTIDTPGVIERVSILFKGHPNLISGFNSFLPPGYRIECLSNDMIKVTGPLEFNHAIHYINKIKSRFLNDDDKYQQFLDILSEYQKGEPTNKVYNQIQRLFDGQQDLLSEFKLFLPKSSSLPPVQNEAEFFDHVKHDINNNSIYHDFLKLHNLYIQRVIDRHTLLERAESFLSNDQFQTYQALVKSKKRRRRNSNKRNIGMIKQEPDCGPSYRMIPKTWRMQKCSGRDELCYQVLNDEYVSHPTWASEDGGFIASKKNHHEEALHILEEERYSYDLNIVTTLNTISLLQVISQSIDTMSQDEKKEYKLPLDLGGHSKTIHKAVIRKVYGKEKGNEMMDMLYSNPIQTIPTLLKRLTQKYEEWVKIQRDKANSWHDIEHRNYRRSLDYQSAPFKLNDRKHISQKALTTEIEAIQFDQEEEAAQFLFDLGQPSIIEDIVHLLYHYLKRPEFSNSMTGQVQEFINGFLYAFFDLLLKTVDTNAKSIFIGNTAFYCFFRLFQMAYDRLEVLKEFMADEETSFQTLVDNLNLTGKSLAILQIDFASGYYHVLLQLIERFINEDIDQHINYSYPSLIPSEDAHQSEYGADADQRRHWISGFTGSAGFAIVSKHEAALFTDGRYFLQASEQLDANWTLMKQGLPGVPTWQEYVVNRLPSGSRIGLDATLTTANDARDLQTQLGNVNSTLVPVSPNPVDVAWAEARPAYPLDPVFVHPVSFAGEAFQSKLDKVRKHLHDHHAHGVMVSALDEIAWLLNLRGSDVDCNPVFYAYVLVTVDQTVLYIQQEKVTDEVKAYLEGVEIRPYHGVFEDLRALQAGLNGKKVFVDGSTSMAIVEAMGAGNVMEERSFINDAKAIKNERELTGMRECHLRDGAALVQYFAWLEQQLQSGQILDEVQAADHLESLRAAQADYIGLSFPTISSTGANGAIIHYEPERGNCKVIDPHQIYLCDSGAQYRDGTTDVTRTYHFGTPSAYEKTCFTAVLQGHIALDRAVFPIGTTGYLLDPFARAHLWELGLDYRHGTGHGVGSFLNVHEGPHGISNRPHNNTPLAACMTVTDEPGYYEDGKFGIRIENILLIRKADTPNNFGDRGYLGFEHVTMVPIGLNLIDVDALSPKEKQWINSYHDECRNKLGPLVASDAVAVAWLERETTHI
ncbi:hypothetical protein K501DRAFT_329437 [Backusella circina FSU 941]|nr:hypothetical protein K501DRAFT_329437 [Backusella circina FSU 941]